MEDSVKYYGIHSIGWAFWLEFLIDLLCRPRASDKASQKIQIQKDGKTLELNADYLDGFPVDDNDTWRSDLVFVLIGTTSLDHMVLPMVVRTSSGTGGAAVTPGGHAVI